MQLMKFQTEREFGDYLAGLMEGAGDFYHTYLIIVFKPQDSKIAYFLQQKLGFGEVMLYKHELFLKIHGNPKGLAHVFSLVNGRLVGNRCIDQLLFHNYDGRFGKALLPPLGKVSLDTAWFAGYFDACGDLEIVVTANQKSRFKKAANLKFWVGLKERKEYANLNRIADAFNMKKAFEKNLRKPQSFQLPTCRIEKMRLLVIYLDQFQLRTSKWTQFQIFRNATAFMEAKHHLSEKGLAQMAQWKDDCINVYPVALGKRQPIPDILVPTVAEGEPMTMGEAHYLAGLIEGDGCFTPTGLTIEFKTQDIEQAEALKNQLNFGEVIVKDRVIYQVTDPKGLAHIIGLVNGKFIGDRCISQLRKHCYDSLYKVTLLPALGKVSLANGWLSGFLDVNLKLRIRTPTKTCKNVASLVFKLYERSPSDAESKPNNLNLIREVFHINNTKDSFYKGFYRLNIIGQARIKAMFSYLDMFPLKSRKAMQLKIMRDCAALIEAKRHLSQEGIDQMELSRLKLKEIYELPLVKVE
jgi:hypothetical protein